MESKNKILIVDDSEVNRNTLSDMLSTEYTVIKASNGPEAMYQLNRYNAEISLVLLDVVIPEMDGFEILQVMRRNGWIENIPVIIISPESASATMERAYDLGAVEYISRPFDIKTVRRRVANTIALYSKQRLLENMLTEQMLEKEKSNLIMVEVLSHIVEFRNGESGLHVLHIRVMTEALLKRLAAMTDRYELTPARISLIVNASALHDIGKISIPEQILNKPGKLTPEEYRVVKQHSAIGAEMLESASYYQNEELVKVARDICRWHHERFDGKGYPDGLIGDEIPIAAQVVALADVYDALVSERVYKPAYSHDKAMEMILGGECGAFNPVLTECLREAGPFLAQELAVRAVSEPDRSQPEIVLRKDSAFNRKLSLLNQEGIKNSFFASVTDEIQFDYSSLTDILTLSEHAAARLGLPALIPAPEKNQRLAAVFGPKNREAFRALVKTAKPTQPVVRGVYSLRTGGKSRWFEAVARPLWIDEDSDELAGVIGIFAPIAKKR